jgi:hypothetical protein
MATAIVVFTAESRDEIIRNGGSQSWAVSKERARHQEFLVCVRNAHNELSDGDEQHGSAFLVGRISNVVAALHPVRPHETGRWMIKISDYAEVEIPDVWHGWRNPIRYTSLEDIGIEPASLSFGVVVQRWVSSRL